MKQEQNKTWDQRLGPAPIHCAGVALANLPKSLIEKWWAT
jgi:hypothetical protein